MEAKVQRRVGMELMKNKSLKVFPENFVENENNQIKLLNFLKKPFLQKLQ
jgi:hypothetical protein